MPNESKTALSVNGQEFHLQSNMKPLLKSCCLHDYVLISRTVLATLLISIGMYLQSWHGVVIVIPLAAGFLGNCLIHKILGLPAYRKSCKPELY